MIVRINQLDVARAESGASWPSEGMLGPFAAPWPRGTRAFEVLVLDRDEQGRPLQDAFRQQQVRHLIPQTAVALREPGEEIVIRLDGPLAAGELLAAMNHLTDEAGNGRFALAEAAKFDPAPGEVLSSVRLHLPPHRLASLCADLNIGLESLVRLRAMAIPADAVDAFLKLPEPQSGGWDEILSQAGFVLSTVRGLGSLLVTARRFDTAVVRSRLIQRLAAAAATTR